MPVLEYRQLLRKAALISLGIHFVLIYGITYTLIVSQPTQTTFFSFLGSILSEREVIYSASTVSKFDPSSAPQLTLEFGGPDLPNGMIMQEKPELSIPKKMSQKTFLKSTFLEPTQDKAAATETNANDPLLLKEPLHVPLKLESYDQN